MVIVPLLGCSFRSPGPVLAVQVLARGGRSIVGAKRAAPVAAPPN